MIKSRVGITIFFFILFFAILVIRIVGITLFPDARLVRTNIAPAKRGIIYDRNGRELAVSSSAFSFYARTISLNEDVKDFLYATLKQTGAFSENELKLLYSNRRFVWIKRKLSPNVREELASLINMLEENKYIQKDELGLIEEEGRFYPSEASADIVGLVGIDNQGLAGIEYSFNNYLNTGYNVHTTIDSQLCSIAYEELKRAMLKHRAEYGSVAIIEVATRDIMALASYPIFNPNDLSSLTRDNLKSKSRGLIYEPGSVMKQFSAGFALDKGIASPHHPRFYSPASMQIGEHTFTSARSYGYVDLTEIIQRSLNIGMIQVASRFSNTEFYEFLRKFGFGKRPQLPVTDIEAGILRPPSRWSRLSKYVIAFGQEIGVTTLQLAVASGVVAGGGLYKSPRIVNSVVNQSGENLYSIETEEYEVMSYSNSVKLLNIMRNVVSEDGTAIRARVEGIPIAGKTGTGQIARSDGSGYYEYLFNAVFTGYVPAENPKFVIVVAINRPHTPEHTGGDVAAPVFANIVRRMIISTSYFVN
jgi:cell division protein FtsI/penicillin-binding protein 2